MDGVENDKIYLEGLLNYQVPQLFELTIWSTIRTDDGKAPIIKDVGNEGKKSKSFLLFIVKGNFVPNMRWDDTKGGLVITMKIFANIMVFSW